MAVKISKTYDDGLAFRFDFPKDLSLSAVDVIDGVPKLRFVPSLHVPSITEEDVAVCVRLCQDKARPEFFYISFPQNHPFYGRHYKDYRPSYLRGTSVGELLAEADWLMKCLNAGVRSDETKTKFKSWAENSQLDGLATSEYFSAAASHGSIFMMCKSVEVDKSDKEMSFSDPKMAINSMRSSSYSKYLTEKFDAIAYYDEPLFLKMKELIKLIVAIEWFVEEKGVKFSAEWMNKHLSRSQSSVRQQQQAITAKSPKLTQEIVDYVLKQFFGDDTIPLLALPAGEIPALHIPSPLSVMIPPVQITTTKTMTERAFQIKHVRKIDALGVSKEFALTISCDDFDVLYQGMNPNTSIPYRNEKGQLCFTVPNVESWSKLFSETVPIPCKFTSNGEMAEIVYGGVTTQNIPVKKDQNATTVKAKATKKEQEVVVNASSRRQKQRPRLSEIPALEVVKRPSSEAVCDHQQRCQEASRGSGVKSAFGIKDGCDYTLASKNGKKIQQSQSVRFSASQKTTVEGQYQAEITAFQEVIVPGSQTEETDDEDTVEEETDEDDTETDVEEQQEDASSNQMDVSQDQDVNAEASQPQRENLTLESPALEQLGADAKGSPTSSDDDSGNFEDMSEMSVSDILSTTDTIDSGLGE